MTSTAHYGLPAAAVLLLPIAASAAEPGNLRADVCVVGGGSGGFGAALAAARAGADVVLVERLDRLGGTSTMGLVSNWEPGPGDPIARELYERLRKIGAAGVTSEQNPDRKQGPFGLWLISPAIPYERTLRRSDALYAKCNGVSFEPEAMSRTMAEILAETGRCKVLLNTRFVAAAAEGPRVTSIRAESTDGTVYRIRAKVFIDATGNVDLCRAIGCETMLGAEPKSRFNEPAAPEKPDPSLNAVSLCYRVRKSTNPVSPQEPGEPAKTWPRAAHVTQLPGGDLLINPLAVLPGRCLISMGYEKAYEACKPIVRAHWRWLHGHAPFEGYEFGEFAPMLGIRESHRVVGEYVLTQHDLLAGLSGQKHPDMIAIADHPMDVHGGGRGGRLTALNGPYGIPYRCLIPMGKENLLVACRGASFTQIAASSCRLSRTIIALGHAAGLAAAQVAKSGASIRNVDVAAIQKQVRLSTSIAECEQTHRPAGPAAH